MINLEEFIISEEAIERMSDEDVLMKHLEEGKPLQDLFGFSDETTVQFYEMAKDILEQKRFEDATNAFTFLTTLNPYISGFWLGLGMAQHQSNEFDSAMFSYSIAFALDGRKIFPYVIAAQCCMDANQFNRAIEVVGQAEKYAEEHAGEEDMEQLLADALAAKQYVLDQKP